MTSAVQAVFIGGPLDLSRLKIENPPSTYKVAQMERSDSGIGLSESSRNALAEAPHFYEAIYRRVDWSTPDGRLLTLYIFDEQQTEQNRSRAAQATSLRDVEYTSLRLRNERLQAKSSTLLDERNAAIDEADGLKRDLATARSLLDAERTWSKYFYGKWGEARRAPQAQEKKSDEKTPRRMLTPLGEPHDWFVTCPEFGCRPA